MKRTSFLIIFILLITLFTACNPESTLVQTESLPTERATSIDTKQPSSPPPISTQTPEPTITASPTEAPTITATAEPEVFIMDEEHSLELAKKILAERLNTNPDLIEVRSIQELEWPDSSLGCPEKGMFYMPFFIPGFKMILETNGHGYDVHIGDGRAVICVDGQPME